MIKGRTQEEVVKELKKFSNVKTVTRDFSLTYKSAITEALPNAKHIVDRFHIDENCTNDLLDYIKRTIPEKIIISKEINENKTDIDTTTVVSSYEKRKQETANKKWKIIQKVKALKNSGFSNAKIASEIGICSYTVSKYLNITEPPIQDSHSIIDEYVPYIEQAIREGKTKEEIYEYIKTKGYSGKESILYHHLKSIKNDIKTNTIKLKRNSLKRLLFISDIDMIKNENLKENIKLYLKQNSEFNYLLQLKNEFRDIMYSGKKDVTKLDEWIEKCKKTVEAPEFIKFVNLIESDIDAVKNAIVYDYSNGVTEGFNNKTKVIKREMYGRCSFELLRLKVLA